MISDWELWACAQQVVDQYGDGALDHAAHRATELAKQGDEAGIATWCAIADRIGRLIDTTGHGQAWH